MSLNYRPRFNNAMSSNWIANERSICTQFKNSPATYSRPRAIYKPLSVAWVYTPIYITSQALADATLFTRNSTRSFVEKNQAKIWQARGRLPEWFQPAGAIRVCADAVTPCYLLNDKRCSEVFPSLEAEPPRGVVVARELDGHELSHFSKFVANHCG